MAVSSQGTTFTFGAAAYIVTNVSVDFGRERRLVGEGHMGLQPDSFEQTYTLHRTVDERPTIEIEYFAESATSAPAPGAEAQLRIQGPMSYGPHGAVCTANRVAAGVGDVLRGTAAFRLTS